MSRHGYCDDLDQKDLAMWRGRVASAIRGKRGQELLRDMRGALDAMPKKRLVRGELQTADGGVCALGCVGARRGIDMSSLDPQENEVVASALNIAECLAREIEYENDDFHGTDEQRWAHIRKWVDANIVEAAK